MVSLSVVIPSYNRGEVLLETIGFLQNQRVQPNEIIVVDQTDYSEQDLILKQLKSYDQDGVIRLVRREEPSIPKAMNCGLLLATSDFVLFLDDDIRLKQDFIEHHVAVACNHTTLAHVGQVLQPNEIPAPRRDDYVSGYGLYEDIEFPFSSTEPALVKNCMAGNLCVNRRKAIDAGGFDENFVGVAYRFETEFCQRMCRYHNDAFYFSPKPVLYHLQIASGGTRNTDHFLTSLSPKHSVGDYYYALLNGSLFESTVYCIRRFFSSIKARFYLKKPWYIPGRMFAEARGFFLALGLKWHGPKLCSKNTPGDV